MSLSFNTNLLNLCATQIFKNSSSSLRPLLAGNYTTSIYTSVTFHQGTRPTVDDFIANYSASYYVTNANSLLYWRTRTTTVYGQASMVDNGIAFSRQISFPPREAQQSGTISFVSFTTGDSNQVFSCVLGDVGTVGSGADFEMPSLSVVVGNGLYYTFSEDPVIKLPGTDPIV